MIPAGTIDQRVVTVFAAWGMSTEVPVMVCHFSFCQPAVSSVEACCSVPGCKSKLWRDSRYVAVGLQLICLTCLQRAAKLASKLEVV